jgi:hypothetical protein
MRAQADWGKMAEGMSRALITYFWGASFEGYPDRYYFNYGSVLSDMVTRLLIWSTVNSRHLPPA